MNRASKPRLSLRAALAAIKFSRAEDHPGSVRRRFQGPTGSPMDKALVPVSTREKSTLREKDNKCEWGKVQPIPTCISPSQSTLSRRKGTLYSLDSFYKITRSKGFPQPGYVEGSQASLLAPDAILAFLARQSPAQPERRRVLQQRQLRNCRPPRPQRRRQPGWSQV